MKKKTLDQIGVRFGTDKSSVHEHAHNYLRHYESALAPLRDKPIKMLEIGVGGGESIRMWLEYFSHPKAQIYGVDINPDSFQSKDEKSRFVFVLGDQASQEFWSNFISQYGGDWDFVSEDGGHYANQVITSHNCLWPHLKAGGFYAIEDLNVSYPDLWEKYGDSFVKPPWTSHMDFIKGKLDEINRGKEIEWMHFSKELAIIKKSS